MFIHQLVYLSTANKPFSSDELRALLLHARNYNDQHHLTGLLLYQDSEFLQLLEGEPAELHRLYERILADPRHGRLRLLADGPVAGRTFPDWRMGFVASCETVAACFAQVKGYADLNDPRLLANAGPNTTPALLALLTDFAQNTEVNDFSD